jgi:hypothetical protein
VSSCAKIGCSKYGVANNPSLLSPREGLAKDAAVAAPAASPSSPSPSLPPPPREGLAKDAAVAAAAASPPSPLPPPPSSSPPPPAAVAWAVAGVSGCVESE